MRLKDVFNRIRRFFFTPITRYSVAVISFMCLLYSVSSIDKTSDAPSIEVDRIIVEKDVSQDPDVQYTTFYLKNAGTSALKLTRIKSGCDCTEVVSISSSIAMHGDVIAVKIKFTPRTGISGGRLVVFSNAENSPYLQLKVGVNSANHVLDF